ncbi:MAG: hypothetical protein VSS75_008760 [Candidatus Parabeggiatoa sp.]|nr:hypothetical protein [Candidatus Parabeggiatoa sp.]
MKLNTSQIRIVMAALNYQLEDLRREHSQFEESQEDELADMTNDILVRECLLGELEASYQQAFDVLERKQASFG